ncbi:MAG: sigma-70 family RNA polymerase sigma factor [Chloroflexi bacterium]|nr:sigma-70 family RNA polymerase sigma factor [Chloroflexota bacterium]
MGKDQTALSELYQRYGALVYGLALRVLNNPGLAEEAAQDTFMKVWNQASMWDGNKGRLSTWLMTITRYTAIDRLRKEHNRTPIAVALEDIEDFIGKRSFFDTPQGQDRQLMRALMRNLPAEQIQVIELAFFQGLSHSEIAEELTLPLGTVKTRLRLGLQKLKVLWLDATLQDNENT